MDTIRHRLYLFVPFVVVVLLQNLVHECIHYIAAVSMGEKVLEFRFLTNGLLSSQVVYATPVAERVGAHWLIIAWAPAIITTLIGYLVYVNRHRWLTRWPPVNVTVWYLGVLFMCIDPLYFGVLSFGVGGDVDAASVVGWPALPVQLVALLVLVVSVWLVIKWQREARSKPDLWSWEC